MSAFTFDDSDAEDEYMSYKKCTLVKPVFPIGKKGDEIEEICVDHENKASITFYRDGKAYIYRIGYFFHDLRVEDDKR